MKENVRGYARLLDPALNKSTGFTNDERDRYGLRGLLPPKVFSLKQQEVRVLDNMRRKESDLERYIYLQGLQDRNETLFFRTVMDHIEDVMPIIYTPTVGQACKEFAAIFRRPRGLYITIEDRGRIAEVLRNWPTDDVRIIVVTDGERILGLGDLGTNGMGIPVGKLALYVACAGIHPGHCLPITLDVGTNNQSLRDDPLYLGLDQDRLRGAEYDAFIAEFMQAVTDVFPGVLVQFEDFVTDNAYRLLHAYQNQCLCFNDDIQGTASVALAGVYAASRATGVAFKDQKVLFLGAGSAATGIADLMVAAFVEAGLDEEDAKKRLWFCNSRGLLTSSSERIADHNRPYAHQAPSMTFLEALDHVKPTILIGATGRPGTFTAQAVEKMASHNETPVIFALSNPTSNAECTAEEAYRWSGGRAVFASGSPFSPVEVDGRLRRPGQGNNAYIFPGIGLGALACQAATITDAMFLAASHALAASVSDASIAVGSLYPPLTQIRSVSLNIAEAVVRQATKDGVAGVDIDEPRSFIEAQMYSPGY